MNQLHLKICKRGDYYTQISNYLHDDFECLTSNPATFVSGSKKFELKIIKTMTFIVIEHLQGEDNYL